MKIYDDMCNVCVCALCIPFITALTEANLAGWREHSNGNIPKRYDLDYDGSIVVSHA